MNTKPSSEQIVLREVPVSIPSPEGERRMEIRCADWDRLMRAMRSLYRPLPRLHIFYSIIFGVAGTAGLTIIPLALYPGCPAWVIPLYAAVFGLGILGGLVLIWLDRQVSVYSKSSTDAVITDMEDIEKHTKGSSTKD